MNKPEWCEVLRERIAKIPKGDRMVSDYALDMFKVIEETAAEMIQSIKAEKASPRPERPEKEKDELFGIIDRILEGELCSVDAHLELIRWRDKTAIDNLNKTEPEERPRKLWEILKSISDKHEEAGTLSGWPEYAKAAIEAVRERVEAIPISYQNHPIVNTLPRTAKEYKDALLAALEEML